ncbi:hypothetical protein cyc_06235 [Cyclospora cayetanensis]|uniref:Uncharacterized protein n=1 Tax=Cyclospora cayetanensis TaxID=88456 RepID=A0A1D3CT71_9EIME|nr:hypothetical protein cyc_06235 [Cyclospora cayetanensis]
MRGDLWGLLGSSSDASFYPFHSTHPGDSKLAFPPNNSIISLGCLICCLAVQGWGRGVIRTGSSDSTDATTTGGCRFLMYRERALKELPTTHPTDYPLSRHHDSPDELASEVEDAVTCQLTDRLSTKNNTERHRTEKWRIARSHEAKEE